MKKEIGQFILAVISSVALMVSCSSPGDKPMDRKDGYTPVLETREDTLFHEVMDGHDVAMAKMGKISRYAKRSRVILDSLRQLPNEQQDPLVIKTYEDMLQRLVVAENAMFQWMGEFKADTLKTDNDKRISYLESEKQKVNTMSRLVLETVSAGDSLFTD